MILSDLRRKECVIFVVLGLLCSFFIYFPILACRYIPLSRKLMGNDLYFVLVLHHTCYLFLTIALYFCYHFDLFRRYKANSNPWPWEENLKEWDSLLTRSGWVLFFNHLIIAPVLVIIFKQYLVWNYKTSFEDLPSIGNFVCQMVICFLCNDFTFHCIHKLIHVPFLYKWIHSIHHQYINVIGISAEYAHPIEYILGNFLPSIIGPLILNLMKFPSFHLVTVWAYTISGVGATIEQHCGYDLPFTPYGVLPFNFASSYHDYHHTRNKGNFSSNFIFWDLIFGNNFEYYNLKELGKLGLD